MILKDISLGIDLEVKVVRLVVIPTKAASAGAAILPGVGTGLCLKAGNALSKFKDMLSK